MADELKSLSDIFNNSLFRIPDYQRGYAWQAGKRDRKSQLGEFWDDLINLVDNKNHYTGLLTLNKLTGDDAKKILDEGSQGTDANVYEIVDGQQRLTTAIILIEVLLERFRTDTQLFQTKLGTRLSKIEEKFIREEIPGRDNVFCYIFGYTRDDPSYNCLRYKIFGEKNPPMGETPDTYYTKNLEDAKNFFRERVAKLDDDDAVKVYKKLVGKLKFNLHEIGDDFDVFVSFETMNNRGKPLSNLELLKNRLIYLSVLFDDKNLRKKITDAWKEIYKQLSRNKDELIADDEFLRAHWITYFGAPNKKQREDISFLMKYFSPRNIKGFVATPEADDDSNDAAPSTDKQIDATVVSKYVDSLSVFAKYYFFTYFPNVADNANNLTDDEKFAILFLNELSVRYFRPLLMVACSKEFSSERLAMFKAIERFIFVNFVMRHYRSDKDQTIYYNFAGKLKDDAANFAAIKSDLNFAVEDELPGARKNFVDEINEKFRRGNGFYDWSYLRYVLAVREYELRKKNNRPDQLIFDAMSGYMDGYRTVEHIFPQTATDYWNDVFKNFDAAQKHVLQNAFGNLLLLPQSDNSSLQNKPFEQKKAQDYISGSQSEIEVAKNSQWTAAEIFARSKTLVEFLNDRWQLNFSDDEKISLIHLPFVK